MDSIEHSIVIIRVTTLISLTYPSIRRYARQLDILRRVVWCEEHNLDSLLLTINKANTQGMH